MLELLGWFFLVGVAVFGLCGAAFMLTYGVALGALDSAGGKVFAVLVVLATVSAWWLVVMLAPFEMSMK